MATHSHYQATDSPHDPGDPGEPEDDASDDDRLADESFVEESLLISDGSISSNPPSPFTKAASLTETPPTELESEAAFSTSDCPPEIAVSGSDVFALSLKRKGYSRFVAPPPFPLPEHVQHGQKCSPPKKKMAAEHAAFCKDDPAHKADDHISEILAEIDPVTVEIPAETFKNRLPGEDMGESEVRRVKTFDTIDLSKFASKAEDVRYDPLCDIFNSLADVSTGNGRFWVTAEHFESNARDFRPDLAYYPDDLSDAAAALLRDMTGADSIKARCAWAWMILAIEIKCLEKDAGYGFETAYPDAEGKVCIPLLRDTPAGRKSRAQFTTYGNEILQRQQRTHVYSVYVSGMNVRFFRFDRAGLVATEPIHLRSQFKLFLDIMYRLLNLSPTEQGFDETARLASEESLRELRAHRPKHNSLLGQYYREYLSPDKLLYPSYEITCSVVSMGDSPQIVHVDDAGEPVSAEKRTFIIAKPITTRDSPTGRCTRGWIAFDKDAKRFVFLKDQWRAVSRRPELDVYRRIHSRVHADGLEFFATPIAGGDISTHRTQSQDDMAHLDSSVRPVERVHTRLVTKEIGRSLDTYRGSYELIKFVSQAFGAHAYAWEEADVLHHDVSPGNILINIETDVAFLNDWDLAKYREELMKGVVASEPAGVSGTWPFKSALALRYPFKPAELADDIESFVYIILFMAMRFHYHELSSAAPKGSSVAQQRFANGKNEALAFRFYEVFHDAEHTNGYYVGGYLKLIAIQAAIVPITLNEDRSKRLVPLARVLKRMYQLLHRHYRRVDSNALEKFSADPAAGGPSRFVRETAVEEKVEEDPKHVPQYAENPFSRHPRLNRRSRAPPSSSSSGSEINVDEGRPLDSHNPMLEILITAFEDDDGNPIDVTIYQNDRLYDQCTNQPVMTSTRRKNFSGVVLAKVIAESLSSASKKRKALEVGQSPKLDPVAEAHDEAGDENGAVAEARDEAGDEQDERASLEPSPRPRRTRTTRAEAAAKEKAQAKKAATAKLDSPPRKAKAAMQATVARKAAAAAPKVEGARTRKAAAAKVSAPAKKTAAKAPAKPVTAKKAAATAKAPAKPATAKARKAAKIADTGATRRSARMAAEPEDALLPAATGKRKRAEKAADPEEGQPAAKTTRTRKMVEAAPVPAPKKPAVSKAKAAASRKAQRVQEAPARRSSRLAAKNA